MTTDVLYDEHQRMDGEPFSATRPLSVIDGLRAANNLAQALDFYASPVVCWAADAAGNGVLRPQRNIPFDNNWVPFTFQGWWFETMRADLETRRFQLGIRWASSAAEESSVAVAVQTAPRGRVAPTAAPFGRDDSRSSTVVFTKSSTTQAWDWAPSPLQIDLSGETFPTRQRTPSTIGGGMVTVPTLRFTVTLFGSRGTATSDATKPIVSALYCNAIPVIDP